MAGLADSVGREGGARLKIANRPGERLAQALRAHAGAIAIGALFLLVTLYYNVSIPLWESDSEWSHYQYVRHIADHHALPQADSQLSMPPVTDLCADGQAVDVRTSQFRQPLLYYVLGALVVSPLPAAPELEVAWNPYVFLPFNQGGYNIAVHSAAEAFPYRGAALAVHTLRFFSSLLGLAGLAATYLTALLLFRRRDLAVAAMAINAFIPQYVFSSSVVNNDILVGALGAWCVYLCVYSLLHYPKPWILLLAAVTAGLAVVSKYSGLALIPLVLAALLWYLIQTWRTRRAKLGAALAQVTAILLMSLSPAILWLARNQALYGQPLVGYDGQTSSFMRLTDSLLRNLVVQSLPVDFLRAGEFALITFWGLFGVDNLSLPAWLVIAFVALALGALIGVLVLIVDKKQPAHVRVLAACGLLFIGEAWALSALKAVGTSEPRGRYLIAIYSTASLLLTAGIYRLLPTRAKLPGLIALCSLFFATTVGVPALLLRPAYAPPTIERSAELRADEMPLHATFGDFAELVGYRVEPDRVLVWDPVRVTLVWRGLKPTPANYTVGVSLLNGANEAHGTLARLPGNGNFATSLWQPGDVFRDTYELYLEPSARKLLPSLGRIKVSMYCSSSDKAYLPATDGQGAPIGDAVYFGRLKLAAPTTGRPPADDSQLLARFDDGLALASFAVANDSAGLLPRQSMTITTTWQALAPPARDYTLFAHLLDARGEQVSGNDLPLTNGYYPASLWEAGEIVDHVHTLPIPFRLPAGAYRLVVGLYDPQTGQRLAVLDSQDTLVVADDTLEVGVFTNTQRNIFLPQVLVQPS